MNVNLPSGVTAKGNDMNVQATSAVASTTSNILPIVFSALLGLSVMVVVGHLQAATLHDAAHDVRHATGFPCH